MKTSKRAALIWAGILLISLYSCTGAREGTLYDMGYPFHKVYPVAEAAMWAAAIESLNRMGFIIEFIDMDLGVIRASDDIRRDLRSFFTGVAYLMEIRIRKVGDGTTLMLLDYPSRRSLHQGVNWDPQANFFQYVEMHMGQNDVARDKRPLGAWSSPGR